MRGNEFYLKGDIVYCIANERLGLPNGLRSAGNEKSYEQTNRADPDKNCEALATEDSCWPLHNYFHSLASLAGLSRAAAKSRPYACDTEP